MNQSSVASETLAHWRYTSGEWAAYLNQEMEAHGKSLRSYRIGASVVVVVAVVIMTALVLIPYLWMGVLWRADVWGPVAGVAVVAGIFLAAIGIYWGLLRQKISRLRTTSGDVFITLKGVSINGVWFDWGYERTGWRFHSARRKPLALTDGTSIQILEFKCSAHNRGARFNEHLTKAERVLVPFGKEREADRVIERLEKEKARYAPNYEY